MIGLSAMGDGVKHLVLEGRQYGISPAPSASAASMDCYVSGRREILRWCKINQYFSLYYYSFAWHAIRGSKVKGLLSNVWVIGIGGGILSGLIVSIITRIIFSGKNNKEYSQKIMSANHEILYALRPNISEESMPKAEIIRALIQSTARKYEVEPSDLFSLEELASELVKEVMDSSFILPEMKKRYCEQLIPLMDLGSDNVKLKAQPELAIQQYRSQAIAVLSGSLGLITAVSTLMLNVFPDIFAYFETGINSSVYMSLIAPILAAAISLSTGLAFGAVYKSVARTRLSRQMDKELQHDHFD